MAGRKSIPDKLKVVAGTDRPDRMNPDAPIPADGIAAAPELLSARAADIFARLSAILLRMGVSSPDHVDNLSLLAQRLEQVEILNILIDAEGYTYKTDAGLWKGNPAVAMRDTAMRHTQSLLSEFGLSPAALNKVSAATAAAVNPFAGLG